MNTEQKHDEALNSAAALLTLACAALERQFNSAVDLKLFARRARKDAEKVARYVAQGRDATEARASAQEYAAAAETAAAEVNERLEEIKTACAQARELCKPFEARHDWRDGLGLIERRLFMKLDEANRRATEAAANLDAAIESATCARQ